jgi:hypothetical protein
MDYHSYPANSVGAGSVEDRRSLDADRQRPNVQTLELVSFPQSCGLLFIHNGFPNVALKVQEFFDDFQLSQPPKNPRTRAFKPESATEGATSSSLSAQGISWPSSVIPFPPT